MRLQKAKISLLPFFLVFLFLLVKYGFPLLISYFYQQGSVSLLNQFLGYSGPSRPMEFYLGNFENFWYGPLSIFLSACFFVYLCFKNQQYLNDKNLFLLIFIFLFLFKAEVVFFPPFGDAVAGFFAEAIWLVNHGFDYVGLSQQPAYVDGGPKIYLFSIYPTFLAVLMGIFENPKLFLLFNHMFVFALGSTCAVLFRNILRRFFDNGTALLGMCLLIFTPLFQAQVELINMEMPTLVFILFSLNNLLEKKFVKSSFFAFLAVTVKAYAVFMSSTVFFCSLLYLILLFKEKRSFSKDAFFSIILSFFTIAWSIFYIFLVLRPTDSSLGVGLFMGSKWFYRSMVPLLYCVSLGFFIWMIVTKKVASFSSNKANNHLGGIYFDSIYEPLTLFIGAGCWFLVFINVFLFGYRYMLILLPFIIFCPLFILNRFIFRKNTLNVLIVSLVMLFSVFSYGINFKFWDGAATDSVRSLEYRNALRLQILVARFVEKNFEHFTIAAPFILAQALAMPELGYVSKNLDVMIYMWPCTYANIKNFDGLSKLDFKRTVWIGTKGYYFNNEFFPIGPYDQVLNEFFFGNHSISLFLGGFSVHMLWHRSQALIEKFKLRQRK